LPFQFVSPPHCRLRRFERERQLQGDLSFIAVSQFKQALGFDVFQLGVDMLQPSLQLSGLNRKLGQFLVELPSMTALQNSWLF